MILDPAIIALLVSSLLITCMLVYATVYGVQIVRSWDIASGSELQLSLERKTYLISTLMTYALGFQLGSFFLFIFTADNLSRLFVGAMCAVGSLSVSPYGYPVLLLKLLNFLLAGLWLIVNHADNKATDYPLIKKKYGCLLGVTPLVLAETILQWQYFLSLKANVITSCCGSLFSATTEGMAAEIAAFPPVPTMIVFSACMVAMFALGMYHYRSGKGGYLFALAGAVTFLAAVAAFISVICLYFYELPSHHCPFCILQKEYRYVGYLLYGTLLGGAVSAMGVGVLQPFGRIASLAAILPIIQRRLALAAMIFYGLFGGISVWQIMVSQLRLS
ncbi:MAG: hypothetical protein EHM51_02090 [Geobacter sp.]|nr:MAG: hypothetical protein EHM51_02090 [Geobacter sp.]